MTSPKDTLPGMCRDCLGDVGEGPRRCPRCRSPRLYRHPELDALAIAHLDCDAFYAAVEKRDNPALRDRPVIVGGGRRGVVATACYVARIHGVRSAMPMFQALKLCPDAVVIPPDMEKYASVGREVRQRMLALTPAVEPLSIDEAFLDLSGTARLHGMSPARALAALALAVEKEIGITVSIGLSHNKFLAKLASDLDKPRGFAAIGRSETQTFLAGRPVSAIYGVGQVMQRELARAGITRIAELQQLDRRELTRRFGVLGTRLYHLARGEDLRVVSSEDDTKSISAETTFDHDLGKVEALARVLWRLAERVSRRAKAEKLAGQTVTLKLKTRDFRLRTRSRSLSDATQLAHRMFDAALPLLEREADGTLFRLIGIGISALVPVEVDPAHDTLDLRLRSKAKVELAMDRLRARFGPAIVAKGRAFGRKTQPGDEDIDD
ncbi:MAG: DNA polymerase IV [Aestuariivirgaceae bacterium]